MKKDMAMFMFIAVVLIAAGAAVSYVYLFRRPNPPLATVKVAIAGAAFNAELATSTLAQARGLSYRQGLGAEDGMLFVFARPGIQNFWMKDMNFPIDIIWIGPNATSGAEEVLGFAENAAPQPGAPLWKLKIYTSPAGTDKVLEVNAGTVAKYNIHIGDAVTVGDSGM